MKDMIQHSLNQKILKVFHQAEIQNIPFHHRFIKRKSTLLRMKLYQTRVEEIEVLKEIREPLP